MVTTSSPASHSNNTWTTIFQVHLHRHQGRMLFIFLILARIVLAQPSPPALGIQFGDPGEGLDVRFPSTVTQCEPVFIYYNNTMASVTRYTEIVFFTPGGAFFLIISIPAGAGYYEWVCNIPAWYGFGVYTHTPSPPLHLIVQPGPLSSCLHNLSTTTYQYASYDTTVFASYTAQAPIATITFLSSDAYAT